ncbi:enoyl-CoA hydratase/isomerase family protein, partial [Vibrio cholerae O1]
QVEEKDGAAYLYFNRPDAMNALNLEMIKELADSLKAIAMKDDIHILVLSGNGKRKIGYRFIDNARFGCLFSRHDFSFPN